MKSKIILGDCLEVFKQLDDNSIDAVVTDPPYGLEFMGKDWDRFRGKFNKKEDNFKGMVLPSQETRNIKCPECNKWLYDHPPRNCMCGGVRREQMRHFQNFNYDWAKEVKRVLKPGGYLLAFSGTRTCHRLTCAIEDAGFEIRDMIAWVYGCLSEDTEILTESGYKPLYKLTQYDRIGVYDITNNIYKWERPQRYSVYKVHQDTAYRIKSDYTDQIVSRNHRCLVEREGKLVFIQAEELNEVEYMPTLSDDFYSLQERHRKLLLKELLWKGKRLAQKLFSKWTGKEMSSERIEVRKEPSLERWYNLLEETRKLQADKICEVSEGVFTDGEKRWICNGTSFDNGSILGDMFRENPSSASYQSRPTGQPIRKSDVIQIKQGTQITRRARVEKIEYSGIIFCPTVSTGAFVARRNGQVFITGNSGFPKSRNIGKDLEKKKVGGIKNLKIIGTKKGIKVETGTQGFSYSKEYVAGKSMGGKQISGDIPVYEINNEWEGWGTALKPALEPISICRKPLAEKTVAENCLKWGVGGINIDATRIPSYNDAYNNDDIFPSHKLSELRGKLYTLLFSCVADKKDFQIPSSVSEYALKWRELKDCLDGYLIYLRLYDELTPLFQEGDQVSFQQLHDAHDGIYRFQQEQTDSLLNQDTDHLSSLDDFLQLILTYIKVNDYTNNDTTPDIKSQGRFPANLILDGSDEVVELFPNDSQRFFYCAKSSRSERNVGCEGLEKKEWIKNACVANRDIRPNTPNANNHPTVKPIALMEYLIKLVSREGHTVLDPFMGSGTTGIACKNLNRDFIGIEKDEEYVKIAEARIKATPTPLI